MSIYEAVICSPVRTAIGAYNGSLKTTAATELGAAAIRETLLRSRLDPAKVDAAVLGNVIEAGNKMNPARQAAIHGGLPVSAPAMTVNRVCDSGAQAIASAAQDIWLGFAQAMVVGGMENMDTAPCLMGSGRWDDRMGDAQIYDAMLRDGLNDAFSDQHSGWHTEDLVERYQISREDQDRRAERSQRRFSEAQAANRFDAEIVPVEVKGREGAEAFARDEHNRPETTLGSLSRLRPAFRKGGTITAGNALGLNTGAAAMVVGTRSFADANGLEPVGRIAAFGVGAVEPGKFGIGPVPAEWQALERAGWAVGDIERVEINEAFAAIALAVHREVGFPEDIVNVDGGAIAHDHPIGATGSILTTRLPHSMKRHGLKGGLVTLCICGGQGIALGLEMLN